MEDSQIGWLEEIAKQFNREHAYHRLETSDLVSECLLKEIGDGIRLHHCFSKEAFTKDKFEYLMERGSNLCGVPAELAKKGNPGYDISIGNVRFSLKTQADKSIKRTHVHISKFMELGKGEWTDKISHLDGQRDRFFAHMEGYDRILVLRTLSKAPQNWEYELVEIPKTLLNLAAHGIMEMMFEAKQMPKPGYCHVYNQLGGLMFQLYFDGGGERKLQIKRIDITNLVVHARWTFPPIELEAEN